jgi:transposase
VNLLLPYPHLVLFPVPASMSASYRKTFVPSGAKDDPGDAGWILDLLLRHRDRLRRLEPDDANTRLLLMLVEDRRQLVDDRTRLALRLQDCLKQYFPQAVKWFDVDTPLVGDLLKEWPDLQHLQRCHDGTLRNASHPDAPIFASFPGAGPATVPRLIAAFGTRRERYQSAFEVQCDSGIAPVHVRSGKIDLVSVRRACQDFTRQTFHEFAGQTLPRCEWANAYYHAHCTKPAEHHAAVRALAFKWIRILFRCWKNRKPYDEQLYVTSLRRRNALLGPGLAPVTSFEWRKVAGFSKLLEK